MINPAAIDVIGLLKRLVNLLQPFAQTHGIVLAFNSKETKLVLPVRPDLLIIDLTSLICNIINYTPQGNTIGVMACTQGKVFKVQVSNTGVNLSLVSEILQCCKQPLIVTGNSEIKQTVFEWSLPVSIHEEDHENANSDAKPGNKKMIPEYYDEVRTRLRFHFSKAIRRKNRSGTKE
jgi:hypothetical protein